MIAVFITLTDIIGMVLVFFGLDDFLILDAITSPIIAVYSISRKGGGWYNIVAGLLELIPYVGALPIRTIGFFLSLKGSPDKSQTPGADQDIKIKKPKGTIAAPQTSK